MNVFNSDYAKALEDYKAGKGPKPKGTLANKIFSKLNFFGVPGAIETMLDSFESLYETKGIINKTLGFIAKIIKTGIHLGSLGVLATIGFFVQNPVISAIILTIAGGLALKFLAQKVTKFLNWYKNRKSEDKNKDKDENDLEEEMENVQQYEQEYEQENQQENQPQKTNKEFMAELEAKRALLAQKEKEYADLSSHGAVSENGGFVASADANRVHGEIIALRHDIYEQQNKEQYKQASREFNANRTRESIQTRMRENQKAMLEALKSGKSIKYTSKNGVEYIIKVEKGTGNLSMDRRVKQADGKMGEWKTCKNASQEQILESLVLESIPGRVDYIEDSTSGKDKGKLSEEAFTNLSQEMASITDKVTEKLIKVVDYQVATGQSTTENAIEGMAYRCTECVFEDRAIERENDLIKGETDLERETAMKAQLGSLKKQEEIADREAAEIRAGDEIIQG